MATIKIEEYPIKDNGFEYLGNHYDCQFAIKRDTKMILQEAETSHKDTFDELYDNNTLRADKIRIFVNEDDIPIYGMIIYLIDYKEKNNSRYACGGYYPFLTIFLLSTHIKKAFVGNKKKMIMTTIKSYTDISQSKKLAKILPLESADNVIVSFGSREGTKTVVMPKETLDIIRTPFADIRETTMCWSLAALLSVLPYGYSSILTKSFNGKDYYCEIDGKPFESQADNPVDACYEMIIRLNELNLL